MSKINIPEEIDRDFYVDNTISQTSLSSITKEIIKVNKHDNMVQKVLDLKFNEADVVKRAPIRLFIDSYGGQVYPTFGLISVIERSMTPVHTIVTGSAMSAAFALAISGHKRFGYKYSTWMWHQVSSILFGEVKGMEDSLDQLKIIQQRAENLVTLKIIQQRAENLVTSSTKITPAQLEENYKLKKDWYFNAMEAKRLSIIDEIL